ncbi:MAG: xanthine dehydrogenase family protein molybdopterin-binding subunit [Acidimicrobiales bacterium]
MTEVPTPFVRLEDPPLLRGDTRFLADLPVPAETLHATFARSPVAAGRLTRIDLTAALEADGVVAAFDATTLGVAPFQHFDDLPPMPQDVLVADRIRHVGEALALVVATSAAAGVDAAERVEIDIEPFPAVVDPAAALAAPPLHAGTDSNLVWELAPEGGSGPAGDGDPPPGGGGGTGTGTVRVELAVTNQRVASAPLENDGILAVPRPDGGLDMWCTLQGVHPARLDLARGLGIEPERIRVRAAAVGGGFGGRGSIQVEYLAVAAAALRLGRPVRWLGTRSENLTGMVHGRGYHTRLALTVDDRGRPLVLEVDAIVDAGSVAHMNGLLMVSARRQAVGLYRIPDLVWRGRAALTNTTPVGAYRGAGQPEANHARERLIDVVARRLGRDPIDYRLELLLTADELPRTQPGGVDYDRADPRAALSRAVELADVHRWRTEQARRIERGDHRRIGVGVGCYAQTSGRGTPADGARVRLEPDGSVTVFSGSASHGQAHLTTLAAIVANRLAIDPSHVTLVDADTDVIADGLSTGGSRSSQVLASVVATTCDDVVDAARPAAAAHLEVAEGDLVIEPAGYGLGPGLAVAGVPTRRITWGDLAADTPAGCLEAARTASVAGASHPYGTHVTVVEVDIETGGVTILLHVAVDDCGRVLQPRIVEGQQHGGSVAGLAQVFWEDAGHDADGNPRGATLLTYLLPSAADLGPIMTDVPGLATDRNPMGTRGIGENGCNGAIASGHNAVIDALAALGVEHIDLPLTPERIWRAVTTAAPLSR